MGTHADHPRRRALIVDAALAVASDQGLHATTIARVADRAGVSVGLVQHYFPSKHELLIDSYRRVLAQVGERVDSAVASSERAGRSIHDMMADALLQFLPLDAARRREHAVRTQFAGLALVEPDLAAVADAATAGLLTRVGTAVDNGRECGETAPDIVTTHAAWRLWAVTEGLAGGLLRAADVPAAAIVGAEVATVFPHPCRRPR